MTSKNSNVKAQTNSGRKEWIQIDTHLRNGAFNQGGIGLCVVVFLSKMKGFTGYLKEFKYGIPPY